MIIVQLKGGLGNQLFQYAAGLHLAHHHNTEIKVDLGLLKNPANETDTLRNYELQYLKHPPLIASEHEIKRLTKASIPFRFIDKLLPSYKRQVYNEKYFTYDVKFLQAGNNVYLKGYRQSEKYFLPIADIIRQRFQFQPGIIQTVQDFGNNLKTVNSASIHIRRGDYTKKTIKHYHGVVTPSYYQEAMAILQTKVTDLHLYVFSDDINWVKEHIKFPIPATFVSNDISTTPYEDFYLMACCRHNIVANSSFSWWAAWLNDNEQKIVIAPKNWFTRRGPSAKDLLPSQWIVI